MIAPDARALEHGATTPRKSRPALFIARLRGSSSGLARARRPRLGIPGVASPGGGLARRPGKRAAKDIPLLIELADTTPVRRRPAPRSHILGRLDLVRDSLRTPLKQKEDEKPRLSKTAGSHAAPRKSRAHL